jgi:hypothetical protein
MEQGDHDRACWQQQLHEQKMDIIRKLADLKKRMVGDDFVDRLRKSTLDVAMEIVRQA